MGRENELYRDKIEVSLDGRQIFSLFFAGAVIVCAVFVIGVIVGKRVEARAHVDRATGVAGDPLAALDRLEADAPLSFRRTLRSGQAAGGSVDAEIAAMASAQQVAQGEDKAGKQEKVEAKAEVKSEGKADAKPEVKADAKPEVKNDAKQEKADKSDAAKASPDDERAESGKSDKAKTDAKTDGDSKSDKDGDKASKDGEGKEGGKDEKKKSRYTLQLSAFQERGEAETFLSELRAAGYSPYVTPAEVDGKAYYRVRLGTYPSYDDAVKAKGEFEKKIGRIAYVTKL